MILAYKQNQVHKKAFADGSKLQETENYVKTTQSKPDPNMFGTAKREERNRCLS